jgi:hypothetical protein
MLSMHEAPDWIPSTKEKENVYLKKTHRQHVRVLLAPHPYQHLVLPEFGFLATVIGV